jgi:urease accessory protein
MRATTTIVAEADGSGGTRLAVLRGEAPLLVRRTGARTGPAEVHLVGGAAGPLGGDRLRMIVDVGPEAELRVRSVAACVVLPGRDGTASCTEVCARVAAGGRLVWLPEPLVVAAGARHETVHTVDLAAGAWLVWRDELVCGRYGEPAGRASLTSEVRLGGSPLYHHQLTVGPGVPGWAGAAVLGGAAAFGSVLLVDPAWADKVPGPAVLGTAAARFPLAGPAVLATATGPDAMAVRGALDQLTATAVPQAAPHRRHSSRPAMAVDRPGLGPARATRP